jgi:tetratricopeptide (TPR) repeat protein
VLTPTRRINRLSRLGGLRRRAGDLRGAEKAYRRALAVAERRLPADDVIAARVRNELGVVLKYTGAFDEAASLYERAHGVFVAALGAAHPDVGMVLHNIGGLAHARGRPQDGESAARSAVSIRAAALGDDHPAVAADRAALAIKERTLGRSHPELVPTLGTLGWVCRRTGNDRDARRLYERALDVLERQGLSRHPHSTALKASLARLDAPA